MSAIVGRMTLAEINQSASEVGGAAGSRTISFKGQESSPALSLAQLMQRHGDIVTLPNLLVPIIFTDKTVQNGYYRITDSTSELMNWQGEVATTSWSLTAQRVGNESEVDLESRLSGAQSRQNDFTVTGERWHAPPIGHYAYATGSTLPTTTIRTGSDGAMTVYRGVPLSTSPRWGCPLASYMNGRVRFIDTDSLERSGVGFTTAATGWQLHNALVRVRPSGTVLEVGCWDTGLANWSVKNYNFQVAGSNLGTPTSVTVLRNEPEMVVVRVMWAASPGRTTADFTLRRGARFVEVWIETQASATIKVVRGTVEAATGSSGYITATANDTDGNKYWLASARTATQDVVNGALSKAATLTLGVAIGAVYDGSTALAGDVASVLFQQYVGTPAERVEGVMR